VPWWIRELDLMWFSHFPNYVGDCMNSVNKSIFLGIIYFIGFGYHPVLKIKSLLLWDHTGLHSHVKIRLKLRGFVRPLKLFSVVGLI